MTSCTTSWRVTTPLRPAFAPERRLKLSADTLPRRRSSTVTLVIFWYACALDSRVEIAASILLTPIEALASLIET